MTIPDQSYFPFMSGDETMDLLARQIRQTVLEYVEKSRLQSLVLGISGGIDSALCAALLQPVCEQLHIPLIGRSITIETNKEDEIQRSIAVGRAFCHDFEHLEVGVLHLHGVRAHGRCATGDFVDRLGFRALGR